MALSARIVKQDGQGVLFRVGRVQGPPNPGFRLIIPFIDVQLRNLQSLVEIGVDKNTTVVFPAPLMTTIAELGSFLAREQAAASPPPLTTAEPIPPPAATANGTAMS
jgi:regulator of protease activity HflC (stomatin/prohibitin superfamily)